MKNIAQRLDGIYKGFRYDNITSERAIRSIIKILDTSNNISESVYDMKYYAELIKKGIRLVLRIDNNSKQTYEFLEECVIVGNLDLNARYEIYNILEKQFPKKVKGIREFLLTHASGYFPEHITQKDGIFQGKYIIKAGLSRFLFKTHKILSRYGEFVFNYNYKGFSCGNCLIVSIKHDLYKNENYDTRFLYAIREGWKIERDTHSYYLIDDKYKIRVKDIIFAVNILKKADGFNEDKLFIQFSNDSDIPIQINYEGSNIKIYFFQDSDIKN